MQVDFRANSVGSVFFDQPTIVQRTALDGAGLRVDGWVFDVRHKALADGVYVSVDGTSDFPAAYGVIRPDLVAHFSDRAYLQAGFFAHVPAAALPRGEHRVSLKVVDASGTAYQESKALAVIVK
jgi:hypothetical protein